MTIKTLVNRELEASEQKFGKDDTLIKVSREIMIHFGYKVLEEINRLNFPAFTIIDSFNRSKRGFVNALLNHLVDKDDEKYGKIHFDEYEDWEDVSICTPSCSTSKNHFLIVEKSDGRYDFAKWSDKTEKWTNQDNKELTDVVKWMEFDRQEL